MEGSIGSRWVFTIKANSTYKGRLVMQGFTQIPGVDCGGTFALVFRLQGICTMLTTAAEMDYKMHMMDVQMVFFNADVEEDVFTEITPGYKINDKQEFLSS